MKLFFGSTVIVTGELVAPWATETALDERESEKSAAGVGGDATTAVDCDGPPPQPATKAIRAKIANQPNSVRARGSRQASTR